MHPSESTKKTKSGLNISDVATTFLSTKLAAGAPHIRAFCGCVGVGAIRAALTLAALSALLLISARPSQAQTEAVLYNFTGGSDGAAPGYGLTSDGAGNFYGTTGLGGSSGTGTVFELSPNVGGGWNLAVLYSFPELADGAYPSAGVIVDGAGNLYGTTAVGGAYGQGVVFELSRVGANWTETVLHSFYSGADGEGSGALIMDPAGNLYGTLYHGGGGTNGAVFELSPSGSGWTEQVIYNVSSGSAAGLTMDAAGNIFGVGNSRAIGNSTVFELSPNGSGGFNPSVIYTFPGLPKPVGALVLDQAGNLYGAADGDAKRCGKVYRLSLGTSGKWAARILYTFIKGGTDGCYPSSGIVFDAAGNIYGTTDGGGSYGHGTVFELVAPVSKHKHKYEERSLWSFNGTDGLLPFGTLILDGAGNLYGTTYAGGSSGDGVVYEVTP